jgi:FG-GAP-like repeat/Putative Ig domain
MRSCWAALVVAMTVALGGCSNSPSLPISVSLTPSSPQAVDQGAPVSMKATITNDTYLKGIAWGLQGVGSLSNTTGLSVSYIPPTGALAGVQKATVIASSVADPTKSASVQITVNPSPALPFQTPAGGTVGAPYSQSIALTGGTAPFQWSVYNGPIETGWEVGGTIPDGLTLDATTGVISGTPTAAGTWYFELTATDADNVFLDQALSIQINPAGSAAANPVPFLNWPLAPAAVAPGSGGLTLRVSGAGFVAGATVDFNGAPLATTFVDSEHLSALVPATDVATAKTAAVTVVNAAPGGGSSDVVYLQVGAPEAGVSFANAANSPLQIPEPFGLAIADFNQDGRPDLAIAASVRLYMLLSNGDGTFTPASGSPVSIPSPPYDDFASPYAGPLTVGDFNHSGHPGLAVSEFNNEAAVILLGNGSGTLVPSSAAFANSPGEPMSAIAAADFNADGNLDLALINSLSGSSVVALGYGKGAFNSAADLYAPGSGVAVGDFNRDGKLDLAVAEDGVVAVWLGDGDGTFTQASGSPISVGNGLSAIVVGDFNGDGKLDLAVADLSGNAVHVVPGNGDGTFQAPIPIAVGHGPAAMVAGDFNNDGKLDLATANGDDTVTLLLGSGDGMFTQASGSPYAVGKGASAIMAADFNGDGRLDLAVANGLDGTVSILLQQ